MNRNNSSRIILQITIICVFTCGGRLMQEHGSVRLTIGRYKVTSRRGSKIIESGKKISSIDQVHRKRAYGPRVVINERNRRRHMDSQRGRPVKSYDFYDQPNDFEWFRSQGHDRYPLQGNVPNYSHEGYESYEKAPDPHDVAQAMNVLEKHMSSSEALGSDNMFKNSGGERHGHHNDHKPIGSNDETGLNDDENDHNNNAYSFGFNDRHGKQGGNEENDNRIAMNDDQNHMHEDGYGQRKENELQFDQNGENPGHDKEQGKEVEGSHQAMNPMGNDMQKSKNWFGKSDQGEKESNDERENEKEHMAEHYLWEKVESPELVHNAGLPSSDKLNNYDKEQHEGWMSLTQRDSNHESPESNHESHESNHESPESNKLQENNHELHDSNHKSYVNEDENYGKMNDVKNSESIGPGMRSNYNEKDRSVLSGNYFEHDDASAKHDYYDGKEHGRENEGRASKSLQNNAQNEEYVDFPTKNDNNNNMNEISNHNNMVGKSTSMNSPPSLYQAQHFEYSAGGQNEQQQNNLNRNRAHQSEHKNPEEIIKIDVGFPQYHLPNTNFESTRHEPHQGPERGGGLWGDLPGSGEQVYKENKNNNDIKVSAEVPRTDAKRGSNEPGGNVKKIAVGEIPEGSYGKYQGKEDSNNLNGGKASRIAQIPVTIKTGVYDSREIFSIDGKKRFISSRTRKSEFNSRDHAHRIALHSRRTSNDKEKRRKRKSKQKMKRKSKKLKHASKKKSFFVQFPMQETIIPSRYNRKMRMQKLDRYEIRFHSDGLDTKNVVSTRHGIGHDLGAVHGFPAVSDEEARHSSPDELLDMANSYRHRAEEYDSKAKELENQAEIQDHQHDCHGAISQHHPHHEGPERGGDASTVVGEHLAHHHGFGSWQAPGWHGPGPFGASHFGHEHGEDGHCDHCDNVIHFNTGYPYYHVPRHQSLPLIEYHKPIPPVHGLNPYEVLTSEQFNRPHLPAGHGNLPYGHSKRTLHAKLGARGAVHERSNTRKSDKDEPSTILHLPKYEKNVDDMLTDENIDNFLL